MPLAVLSAMRECGNYHITVKGGKYLEALAKADTIVFDKTGTLTHATPQVVAEGFNYVTFIGKMNTCSKPLRHLSGSDITGL